MIHSAQVIARIEELLELSGIADDGNKEEMVDHYLSEIEHLISAGTTDQTAIRSTYQKIANTKFKSGAKNNSYTKYLLLLPLIMLGYIWYSNPCPTPAKKNPIVMTSKCSSAPMGYPLAGERHRITSGFGVRTHPFLKIKKFHNGVDIKAPMGTDVLATGAGMVIEAGTDRSYGKYIIIKHNDIYQSKYAHLKSIHVVISQQVKTGDVIGEVGISGSSIAPHLHYEITKDTEFINPSIAIAP